MKTRNTQESLKKQIKDINMKNNEIFSIIRLGTYVLYEKSIVGVDIDCCNEYKQNLLQEAIAACKNDIAKDLINRNIDLNHQDSNGQTPLHYCALVRFIKTVPESQGLFSYYPASRNLDTPVGYFLFCFQNFF